MASMPIYRPNVAFILRNPAGEVLIGRRTDWPECWQFPQGGVKTGESPEAALAREVSEEIGLPPQDYRLAARRGPYRYVFGAGVTKSGFDGQEQTYFLGELTNPHPKIVLERGGEFSAVRWIAPGDYRLAWLPVMKHAVYRDVFRDFLDVELSDDAR